MVRIYKQKKCSKLCIQLWWRLGIGTLIRSCQYNSSKDEGSGVCSQCINPKYSNIAPEKGIEYNFSFNRPSSKHGRIQLIPAFKGFDWLFQHSKVLIGCSSIQRFWLVVPAFKGFDWLFQHSKVLIGCSSVQRFWLVVLAFKGFDWLF